MRHSTVSAVLCPMVQIGTAASLIPGLSPAIGDLLGAIFKLCESVPQNRNAARRLAERCAQLCSPLKQYEGMDIPQRMVQYRDNVLRCLTQVGKTMEKWSQKSWSNMLLHQGEFEVEFNYCDEWISNCLTMFSVGAQMEGLVNQNDGEKWKRSFQDEDEKWKRNLKESWDADHIDVMKQFSAVDFKQRVMDSKVTECHDDIRALQMMMQKGLAGHRIVSEEEQKRLATNLYDLLQLSKQLPPDCQLDGMVELSRDVPISSAHADMFKGRYLHRQDVRIKVIRSANPKDPNTIKRIKREVEIWAKLQEIDKGMHVTPFYGFYTPDGLRLALVSPWMENGDALTYCKKNRYLGYKQLIIGIAQGISVLHSMDPPLIHGNLRAENVLIGDEGQPLITDFALAKLEGNLITQTSGVSDSCRWSAPEMFEDQATVSSKGDIYSFGMTILQLFTHEKPYAKRKTFQVFSKKVAGALPERPRDPDVIKRGLDEAMWNFLCVCWSREPEDRPSIEQIITQF